MLDETIQRKYVGDFHTKTRKLQDQLILGKAWGKNPYFERVKANTQYPMTFQASSEKNPPGKGINPKPRREQGGKLEKVIPVFHIAKLFENFSALKRVSLIWAFA